MLYILIIYPQGWHENNCLFKQIKRRISSLNHKHVPEPFSFFFFFKQEHRQNCKQKDGVSDIHTTSAGGQDSQLSCYDE